MAKNTPEPKSLFLVASGFLIPSLASRVAREALGSAYQRATNTPPPKNPAAPDVDLKDALLWSALAGAMGGIAAMSARRALAETPLPAEGHDMGESLNDLRDS